MENLGTCSPSNVLSSVSHEENNVLSEEISGTASNDSSNSLSFGKTECGFIMKCALNTLSCEEMALKEELEPAPEMEMMDCLSRELVDAIEQSIDDADIEVKSIDYNTLLSTGEQGSEAHLYTNDLASGEDTAPSNLQYSKQYQSFPGYSISDYPQSYYSQTVPKNQVTALQTAVETLQANRMPGGNFQELCDRIWKHNNQKASLFLQERLRLAIPGEYEILVSIINDQAEVLMKHRFGNFLVQKMLETAQIDDIERFSASIAGKVSVLAKHQFCCHVLQKLLDVSPLIVQARIASELLDDVYGTMTSTFGSHVWQKILHLPWSDSLPSLAVLANNAVQLQIPQQGWIAIASTEAGCSTIRSYLCLGENERLECVQDLLGNLNQLMTTNVFTTGVVCKLAMLSSTRGRMMAALLSKAYEYSCDPVGSEIIIHLLRLKIPSFPARFNNAITPFRSQLVSNENGSAVLSVLDRTHHVHSSRRGKD